MITGDNFSYFFMKTYSEALLMSTHNIVLRFYRELVKIIPKLSSNISL